MKSQIIVFVRVCVLALHITFIFFSWSNTVQQIPALGMNIKSKPEGVV